MFNPKVIFTGKNYDNVPSPASFYIKKNNWKKNNKTIAIDQNNNTATDSVTIFMINLNFDK